jgi:hypothetical protein
MAADERRLTRIEVFAHPLPHGLWREGFGPENGRAETCPTLTTAPLAVNDLRAICRGLTVVE